MNLTGQHLKESSDLYLARFTAYNKAKGGELELSLYNTETDLDYQYYFDSQGFLGLRFDGKDEFFINVDQNNSQTKFKTTKDRLNFQSATGTYSFNTPDFSSSLNIKADTDFIGFTTSISNDAGLYGIRHTSNRTVSLVNSNGEIRLGTNGAINFIKGSDQITITPGGTGTTSSSNGTINATSFSSIKVKLLRLATNNSRPIACFSTRVDSEDPLTTTYAGLATPANRDISPLVNGTDGKFVVQYIETKDSSKTNIFNGSAQFTGQVELPGGGGPTQAVTRGEVETMIDGLTPGPGVGDITSVIAGDGINGGGSMGDVTVSVNNTVVRTSGNQTINGNKTFGSAVTVAAGSTNNHALRKSQIEDLINTAINEIGITSVKDFGAVGDGSTDDPAAIQAAFDSSAKGIYFPAGLYVLSSTVTSNVDDRKIFGDGAITANANLNKALQFTGSNIELTLDCEGNKFINVYAQFNDCVKPYIHDCRVNELQSPDNGTGGKAIAFEFFTDIDSGAKITDNYITNLNAYGDGTYGNGKRHGKSYCF